MNSNNENIYKVLVPNTAELEVNKLTNEIYFVKSLSKTGKYTQEYSKAVFKADEILRNSPYKDYELLKEYFLNPSLYYNKKLSFKELKLENKSLFIKAPKSFIKALENLIKYDNNSKSLTSFMYQKEFIPTRLDVWLLLLGRLATTIIMKNGLYIG